MFILYHGKNVFSSAVIFWNITPVLYEDFLFFIAVMLIICVSVLTAFISHSLSRERLLFVFKSMLPPLRNKIVLDIGSRLGAVLYGVRISNKRQKLRSRCCVYIMFGLANRKLCWYFIWCIKKKKKKKKLFMMKCFKKNFC